jgi:hypothetical protein
MDHSRFQRYEEHFVNSLRIVDREICIGAEQKGGRHEGLKLSSDDYLPMRNSDLNAFQNQTGRPTSKLDRSCWKLKDISMLLISNFG